MKNGDFFSLLYSNAELCFRCQPMREKRQTDSKNQNNYIKEERIMSALRDRIMERVEKDCEGSSVISVFLQHVGDMGWFLQKIQ